MPYKNTVINNYLNTVKHNLCIKLVKTGNQNVQKCPEYIREKYFFNIVYKLAFLFA